MADPQGPVQPPAPTPQPQAPLGEQPPQPVKPKATRRQKITGIVTVVVILGILGAIFYATRNEPTNAKAGECVRQDGDNHVVVVKCDDPKAEFKVAGRVEGKKQFDTRDACKPWDDATSSYWSGKQGGEGYVLCLAPIKK
jgi:hypothetical protein